MKRSFVRSLFIMLLVFGFSGTIAAQLEAIINPAGEETLSAEERDVEPYRSAALKRVRARRSDLALQPYIRARVDGHRDFFVRLPEYPRPIPMIFPPILQILRI